MRKKITRITAFLLIFLLALGFALPFLMEKKVGELLKSNVNEQIHGDFDFDKITLSIYKDFPDAIVVLRDVRLINQEPFEGDTLFRSSHVQLRVGIGEFFEGTSDPLEIKEFKVDSARLSLKVNDSGIANYNIGRTSAAAKSNNNTGESTVLSIRSYEIRDSEISYWDAASKTLLEIAKFNHRGSGDLSSGKSKLQTESEALVSLLIDKTKYLERNTVNLNALLGIDLETNTYTFMDNEALINRLPIAFDGEIRLIEEGQEYDLSFKTISSDFRNLLALVPEQYSKDISNLQTSGNFDLEGQIQGLLSEQTIPAFSISMNAKDASFKYPQLPKKVENIYINAHLENTTGYTEDTEINIGRASFQIDKDTFEIAARIGQLTGNISVDSRAKGSIDLSSVSQAYPVPENLNMSGKLRADMKAAFRLDQIEERKYKEIDLEGIVKIVGLNYHFEALPNPLKIHNLQAKLGGWKIEIEEIAGKTGNTDFSTSGSLRNTLGYVFNDEVLRGKFEMRSNSFVVADFMDEETSDNALSEVEAKAKAEAEAEAEAEDGFKVPANLNINVDALVGKAVYDNIVMYDLVGNLKIKDQEITFSEISSRMMDGRIIIDGTVSTQEDKPSFDIALDMSKLNIAKAFESMEMLQVVSPAVGALDGRMSTKMKLSGKLTDQLDLDFNSLSGNILAELLTAELSSEKAPVLNLVDNKLGFVELDKMDLSGLKTALYLENGKVEVKPFTVSYDDISVEVKGGHSISRALDYQLKFDVPAEYLGDDVNKLLSSINDPDLGEIHIPVIAQVGGSYDKPTLKSDVKSQTRVLTDQLVEIQKQKYLNQGKNKLNEIVGDVLANKDESQDRAADGESTKNPLSEALQNIPNRNTDSTKVAEKDSKSNSEVKKAAKSLLNGLLKSNKKAVTAKDTLN